VADHKLPRNELRRVAVLALRAAHWLDLRHMLRDGEEAALKNARELVSEIEALVPRVRLELITDPEVRAVCVDAEELER
jgi:glutamate/tyrosine decarboxylase-like PLP-dependent enzyme